jgi:HK97 gp10 family phage protein
VITLDTSEVADLAHDLKLGAASAVGRVSKVMRRTAYAIQADAMVLAPVDTGNLRSSIAARPGALSAEVVADTDYSVFVELGTSRMAGQPFMSPAFDRQLPIFENALAEAAAAVLNH